MKVFMSHKAVSCYTELPAGFGAHGHIPRELTILPHLTGLVLDHNELSGFVPTFLVNIPELYLDANQLTGTIPASLFQLAQNLSSIFLGANLLTGPIPSEIGLFPGLQVDLSDNQLSGLLPSELFDLEMLEWLWLNGNHVRIF